MRREHKYAQALRWIADGENLQVRGGRDHRWMELSERNEIVTYEILRGGSEYEFRIKPRTVKIGKREVEAPVLEPVAGQELWYWDQRRWEPEGTTWNPALKSDNFMKAGLFFASPEACHAAREAVTALMRGEA